MTIMSSCDQVADAQANFPVFNSKDYLVFSVIIIIHHFSSITLHTIRILWILRYYKLTLYVHA